MTMPYGYISRLQVLLVGHGPSVQLGMSLRMFISHIIVSFL